MTFRIADLGMLFILVLLAGLFSVLTLEMQQPNGESAAVACWRQLSPQQQQSCLVLAGPDDEFAEAITKRMGEASSRLVSGEPQEARMAIEALQPESNPHTIVASPAASQWKLLANLEERFPDLQVQLIRAEPYLWPNFLKRENLLNIVAQILVYAVIAVGMTLVVMTSGIDLSVGSLVALSAVLVTLWIRDWGGGEEARPSTVILIAFGAIAVCGMVGLLSGVWVAFFQVPPFISTLSMMLMASGVAFLLSEGQSIAQVPKSFVWLGRGTFWGIPNAFWILGILYGGTHVVMTRFAYGRCVLAIGGNREAARLAGISVRPILVSTYAICGFLAGLGGVILASQLESGAANYGSMYELYVIAAVVVGGTSLRGGEGNVLSTLVGAFLIAVIQNGMNLMNIESYTQKVVFGLVILLAVLIDNWRRGKDNARD